MARMARPRVKASVVTSWQAKPLSPQSNQQRKSHQILVAFFIAQRQADAASAARRIDIAPGLINLAAQGTTLVRRQPCIAARLLLLLPFHIAIVVVTAIIRWTPVVIAALILVTAIAVIALHVRTEWIILKSRLRKRHRRTCKGTDQQQHQSRSFQCYIHHHLPQRFEQPVRPC